jgi:hypothetical protein
MQAEPKKFWKRLSFAMCWAALLVWLFAWAIEANYNNTLPRQSNPSTARIYAYNYHGIVLWRTRAEGVREDLLAGVSALLFVGHSDRSFHLQDAVHFEKERDPSADSVSGPTFLIRSDY